MPPNNSYSYLRAKLISKATDGMITKSEDNKEGKIEGLSMFVTINTHKERLSCYFVSMSSVRKYSLCSLTIKNNK